MLVAEEAADEAPAARPKTHPGLIIPNIQFINLEGDDRAPPERLPAAIPPRACHAVKPCQLFPGKRKAAGRQEVAPSRAGEPQPWGTGWGGRWGCSGQTPNLKSSAMGRIPLHPPLLGDVPARPQPLGTHHARTGEARRRGPEGARRWGSSSRGHRSPRGLTAGDAKSEAGAFGTALTAGPARGSRRSGSPEDPGHQPTLGLCREGHPLEGGRAPQNRQGSLGQAELPGTGRAPRGTPANVHGVGAVPTPQAAPRIGASPPRLISPQADSSQKSLAPCRGGL